MAHAIAHDLPTDSCDHSESQADATERFEAALRRFDEENSQDPNRESAGGLPCPANCSTRSG